VPGEVTVEFENTVLQVQRRKFSVAVGSSLYDGV
jgi:hypothetical protein